MCATAIFWRRSAWMATSLFVLGLVGTLRADIYPLPAPDTNVIGDTYSIQAKYGEVTHLLVRKHRVGLDEFSDANPHIDRHWIKKGQKLTIPRQFILPPGPREGIVINLAEKRLYYYMPEKNAVATYPITIGRPGWLTPVMDTKVVQKRKHPRWYVPDSIREYMAKKGVNLPDSMPPGPNNPLGDYAMRLGNWTILIHGTNNPKDIGIRMSSGCIRLHPDDIKALFAMVPKGTPVRIIDEPYKVAKHNGNLYIESHMGQHELWRSEQKRKEKLFQSMLQAVSKEQFDEYWDVVVKIANMEVGYPLPVFQPIQSAAMEPETDDSWF